MKLNRSIEAWDKCDAGAMSKMSEAAIKYAFDDAKKDIKALAAIQAQLVKQLGDLLAMCERQEDFNDDGDGGMFERAHAALAAAGAQP